MLKNIFVAKRLHKALGIVFAFVIIIFSLSGIILNHRHFFRNIDFKRKYLPQSYKYNNWNNNLIRGTISYDGINTIVYGSEGIFCLNNRLNSLRSLNAGIPTSSEGKDIYSMTQTQDGEIFAVSSYNIYRYDTDRWERFEKKDLRGRFTNVTTRADSLIITSRDNIYVLKKPYTSIKKIVLPPDKNTKYRMSLFRFVWFLHSGEMFGIAGKLFVDFIAVVFVVISLTGLTFTVVFGILKRNKSEKNKQNNVNKKILAKSIRLHNNLGKGLLYVLIFVVITGGFLRPPLMLALIKGELPAIPFTHFDTPNTWKDKLRFVRYDEDFNDWILYTSDGLFSLKTLDSKPERIDCSTPISVMGINVMTKTDNKWLIGSFEGLYMWDRKTNKTTDFFNGKDVKRKKGLVPPSFENMITGIIKTNDGNIYPVRYDKGLDSGLCVAMPENLSDVASISLWNLALEIHSGRIFKPFIGKFQVLYIFISSVSIVVVLITGFRVYNKRYKKRKT